MTFVVANITELADSSGSNVVLVAEDGTSLLLSVADASTYEIGAAYTLALTPQS